MLSNRDSLINQLKGVLPYADSWYEGLADKQLVAIHKRNLNKIVIEAIRRDEIETRRKLGMSPVVEHNAEHGIFTVEEHNARFSNSAVYEHNVQLSLF